MDPKLIEVVARLEALEARVTQLEGPRDDDVAAGAVPPPEKEGDAKG